MTIAIMKSLKHTRADSMIKSFVQHHPAAALLSMFIVTPILMLLAVGISSTAVMLPISLLCGWI